MGARPTMGSTLMDHDQLKLAAIRACQLRDQDPHEDVHCVEHGEYQGTAPRWTIVAQELRSLEPLLHGICFAYETLPRQGDSP